jgi:hypothetical protein
MSNEVMVSDGKAMPSVSEETRFMMDMISQIALNPDADVEKLRAVMDMKMQMFNRGAEIEFNAAMALAQAEIEPVARTASNQQTKSKYAKLENIISTCSPVWTKHGFALSYDTGDCPLERHYRVTCEVSHRAGHSKHYHMDLPIDDAGINGTKNKTGVHGAGSTISYGKRYIACNIFNIAIKDEDNDGNGNLPPPEKKPEVKKTAIKDEILTYAIGEIQGRRAPLSKLLDNHTFTDSQKVTIKAAFPQVVL